MSNKARDFRPARRRGFDDDNFQTSPRNFGYTPGDPSAPRFEAPAGPPVRAIVKGYNSQKGFGFVQLADGSGDAFLHASALQRGGYGSAPPSATIEARIGSGPKGPQISEVISVDTSTALREPARRARPEPRHAPPDQAAAVSQPRADRRGG